MEQKFSSTSKKKIHLGCGRKILEDYVNVDIVDAEGVDLVFDINKGIPFENNSFTEALAIDFIEHLKPNRVIHFMNEIHRVLEPGGIFKIHVPEAPGITAYQDPTHISFWNEESFNYYIDQNPQREKYGVHYGITAKFMMASFRRENHMWKKFFKTLNLNYLSNYVLDIELVAIKD